MAAEDPPLTLDDLQRQVLLSQIALFAKANPDPEAQQDYFSLADAVSHLEVQPALIPRLTAILEICLSGERLRRTAGPGAHLALTALFQKTPRGKELAAQLASLNAALTQLKDHQLLEISAAQRGPGIHTLTLATPACRIVIRFDPDGARVESLEVGGE